MKERNDSEYNRGNINLSKVKFVGIPVGRLLDHAAILGSDQETLEGLRKAREVLEEKGLIVLDVHHARFDVFASGLNLFKALDIDKCVIPSSIKNLNRPLISNYVDELRKMKGLEIFPTFRKAKYVSEDERRIYKDMPEEERKMKNNAYVERALEILNEPRSVVFVAVYGGLNRPDGESIPHGIETILRTGNPALCTLSVYGKRFLPITTYLSGDLLSFNKNSLNRDMYTTITAVHGRIAARVNFDTDYFNYHKSPHHAP
jgi:hypothetical protein